MNLTVFVPTRNNQATLENLIASIKPLNPTIIFIDFGSTDQTNRIAEQYGKVYRNVNEQDRSYAINLLVERHGSEWNMLMHPWEALIQGHDQILKATKHAYYFTCLQDMILNKEVRLWRKGKGTFTNPVFEYVEAETDAEMKAIVYSNGHVDYDYSFDLVKKWQERVPRAHEPYYYHACCLLAKRKYQDFLKMAEYYMFLDNRNVTSTIMNRYYYAMISLQVNKKVQPVLQNVNVCLCSKPLMAEFWCVVGDVYYHLLKNFKLAKEHYSNAIFLGKRRLSSDKWPMDISKYGEYPEKMIASCEALLKSRAVYVN